MNITPQQEQEAFEDKFVAAFEACLFNPRLKRSAVKELRACLSKSKIGILGQASFLEHNGNIKTLHSCVHSDVSALFYLLIEEGYNLTEIGQKIKPCIKRKRKFGRTNVQYWADKWSSKLKLISRDPLSKGRGTSYQRTEEHAGLHKHIDTVIRQVLAKKKRGEWERTLPQELLSKKDENIAYK
jgi:hypothetical protein